MPLEVFGLCYKTLGAAKSRTKNKARLSDQRLAVLII